jgi:capsular polysaccharide biosynthesis protein
MNILEYVRIIVRRGWIMVVLAIVAGVAAYVFSTQLTPVYRATQTILVVPSRTDNGLTLATIQLLNSRVAYLNSDLVAQSIVDELQLDMQPAELRGKTTISTIRDNITIQIDVDMEAPDGEQASRLIAPIAAAWGNALIRYQDDLNQKARNEDRITTQPQDSPKVSLLRPQVRVNALIGAVAGFFVGAIIVFILEFLESGIVRRRDDLERADLRVLAVVPFETFKTEVGK